MKDTQSMREEWWGTVVPAQLPGQRVTEYPISGDEVRRGALCHKRSVINELGYISWVPCGASLRRRQEGSGRIRA